MKILIVEDHAIVRGALRQVCAGLNATLIEADNGDTALTLQRSERPQIIMLDLNLPGVSGLELLHRMLKINPAARVLVFSMHNEQVYASRALSMGAKGYVSKNAPPEELRTALQRVAQGLTYVESEIAQQLAALPNEQRQNLSERDLEILRLLGEGRSLSEIADTLGQAYKTIANNATTIKSKLGVSRTSDLIRMSIEMRLPRDGGAKKSRAS